MDKIKNVRMLESRPGFRKVPIGFYFYRNSLKIMGEIFTFSHSKFFKTVFISLTKYTVI